MGFVYLKWVVGKNFFKALINYVKEKSCNCLNTYLQLIWLLNLPIATFPKREGGQEIQVTYKDYFEDRYRIQIRDLKQPLLVSVPKERDRRGGFKVRLEVLTDFAGQSQSRVKTKPFDYRRS